MMLGITIMSMLASRHATDAFSSITKSFVATFQENVRKATTPSNVGQKSNAIVLPLLQAASMRQSITNRIKVERIIDELIPVALENPQTMRKPILSGSYRTVWSTVTGDNFVGVLLNHPPSNILGGPSWQVIDGTKGTNIVYWKEFDLRMAGLASLSPLDGNDGYDLQIRGLEFRWGADGCPEQHQQTNNNSKKNSKDSDNGKAWNVFSLPEEKQLGNGVGTLELLYNDGVVRVTRDALRDNTYIHMREPLSLDYQKMFSPHKI